MHAGSSKELLLGAWQRMCLEVPDYAAVKVRFD